MVTAKLQYVCHANTDETLIQKVWLKPLCPIEGTSVLPGGENMKHRQWVSLFDFQWCATVLPPTCMRRHHMLVPLVLSGHSVPRGWVPLIVPSLFEKFPFSTAMTECCPITRKGVQM